MLRDIHQLETFHCSEALYCRRQKEYQKDPDELKKKSVTEWWNVSWVSLVGCF